jgi:tetratricopeptide (TPR) repeat protein
VAHLIGGTAEARRGRIDLARRRAALQRELGRHDDAAKTAIQHGLTGEIALAERRLADAETAFRAAEYHVASSFAIHPALVLLMNNLPTRDGLVRILVARGEIADAITCYRQLNAPAATSKWTSLFDPRFVLATARLAARTGDREGARADYTRLLQYWSRADARLPELAEARQQTADVRLAQAR